MLNEDKVEAVTKMLISSKMFSGYGIRTMGEGEAGYNPMSYHDGSIWPHDNSMTLLGMSKVGRQDAVKTVIGGLIKAASHFEYDRLPELFCGYDQSIGKAVKYPVACSPQAWAAGTPLVFIQTMLGLFPNSLQKEIYVKPHLLDDMNELLVKNITIGDGHLSLLVSRTENGVKTELLKNTTGYKIITN
jgi:glycogen debranching enzyme